MKAYIFLNEDIFDLMIQGTNVWFIGARISVPRLEPGMGLGIANTPLLHFNGFIQNSTKQLKGLQTLSETIK